jgi:elongation factor P
MWEVAMNIPIKKGSLLRHHGRFYFVENITERHSGQQRPAIHVSLRDALTPRHIERTLDELMPIEEVACAYRGMQYLYGKGPAHVFMDSETFDEVELQPDALQGFEPFLKEGEEFRVLYAADQPLRLDTPDSVILEIADTAAPTHAVGTSSNILKEATLENGLQVRVPLFIKTGDSVRIDTRTKQYLGKAQT